jgi:regulator of protease activity HflC (stomatin/prohibitin superfamily)
MKADYLTYRRGTSVSILGFSIQTVLALVLLIYSQYAQDPTAFTAALYAGIGLAVWVVLAVMFDLHRRERLEAMEIEAIGSGETGSAFSGGDEELRVAARRLASMQRFFLPSVSVVIAVGLIAAGWWRLEVGRRLLAAEDALDPRYPGWAISIGIGVAFVGFVFAGFVSGMAKQRVWGALRAGAAWIVGVALFGFAMAVSQFVLYAAREEVLLRYLPVVVSVVMIGLGVEIIISFVLNLYRPRRPGEDQRPAFDSRFLGFLAAPDKIAESIGEAVNYQFGVDVTGSWFYQLLSRWIVLLIGLGALTAWLMTALVVVEPDQRALLLTLGQPAEEVLEPGLHMKWPWPISTIEIPVYEKSGSQEPIYTATGVRVIQIGTSPPDSGTGPILWTQQHATNEDYLIVQPPHGESREERESSAPAAALIAVEVPLQFSIGDVLAYERLGTPGMRDDLLRAVGRRVVTQYLAQLPLDDILGARRSELAVELRDRLEAEYGKLNGGAGAGIEILFVGVEGVHPPQEVAAKFESVVQSQQLRAAAIEDAERVKIETLTRAAGSVPAAERVAGMLDELDGLKEAGGAEKEVAALRLAIQRELVRSGGEMGKLLIEASAQRWTRHLDERGRAALYVGQVESYRAAPAVYRAKKYLEALSSAMADARVYIVPDGNGLVQMMLEDEATSQEMFDPNAGAPE